MDVRLKTTEKKIWSCPVCGRQFRRAGQPHSCAYYPVAQHLSGRDEGVKQIYSQLIDGLRRRVDGFIVESLPCCIHLVHGAYTFAAVYVMRDRVRLHLVLPELPASLRIDRAMKISSKRYLCSVDLKRQQDLDGQFFDWMKQAYLPSLS